MAKFKITDKHVAFVNGIVGGLSARDSYVQHMAVKETLTLQSASVTASRLLSRPEMKQLLERTRLAREEAITGEISRQVAKEFTVAPLTLTELDAFHYAIIQGQVEVEEVVPVYRWTEKVNDEGKVVSRSKEANFMRIKRPPNVREKQISCDMIYKRNGNYAAKKFLGAFKNVDDEGAESNVQRVIILSNGEKLFLP